VEPERVSPADLTGKKTLILGEVKVGKTLLLKRIVKEFLEAGGEHCALVDLAPELTRGIGGKMNLLWHPRLTVYSPRIVAPRLTGRDQEEVAQLAEANGRACDRVFGEYLDDPRPCLFINDASLYLQAREVSGLASLLEASPTVVANGYFGRALGGGGFGDNERQRMQEFMALCDRVINLPMVS